MPPALVLIPAALLATAAIWAYGEFADQRRVRVPAALALFVGLAVAGPVVGGVFTSFEVGNAYAEHLMPFREAAAARLEEGECDRVLAELRALEGQFTYESGLTFQVLEESTKRLRAPRVPARGADAPSLAE